MHLWSAGELDPSGSVLAALWRPSRHFAVQFAAVAEPSSRLPSGAATTVIGPSWVPTVATAAVRATGQVVAAAGRRSFHLLGSGCREHTGTSCRSIVIELAIRG